MVLRKPVSLLLSFRSFTENLGTTSPRVMGSLEMWQAPLPRLLGNRPSHRKHQWGLFPRAVYVSTQFSLLPARCWTPSWRHCFRAFYPCPVFIPLSPVTLPISTELKEEGLQRKESFDFSDNFAYACVFSHSFLHIKGCSCRLETLAPCGLLPASHGTPLILAIEQAMNLLGEQTMQVDGSLVYVHPSFLRRTSASRNCRVLANWGGHPLSCQMSCRDRASQSHVWNLYGRGKCSEMWSSRHPKNTVRC